MINIEWLAHKYSQLSLRIHVIGNPMNACVCYYLTLADWCLIHFNTLRPRQDGRHFTDDIFTCNFFNENCCILIKFSQKYVRKGPIDNNAALVQIMTWRRSDDKPLSETMMISLPTHICVIRPQWVKKCNLPLNGVGYSIHILFSIFQDTHHW